MFHLWLFREYRIIIHFFLININIKNLNTMNLSKLLATLFLSSIFVFSVQASEEVKSPNGRYFIDVNIESGRPYLVIKNKSIKGELPLQKIRLGLTFQNTQSDEWKLTDRSGVAKHKDDYQMITGKRSHWINGANGSP